jgi:hypothetical protein
LTVSVKVLKDLKKKESIQKHHSGSRIENELEERKSGNGTVLEADDINQLRGNFELNEDGEEVGIERKGGF